MGPQMVPVFAEKQTMRMTPKIVAYHPAFLVNDGEKYVTVEVDLNEWYDDKEVLQKLAELYGVKTAGELVQSIEKSLPLVAQSSDRVKSAVDKGILGVRLAPVSPQAIADAPWWRTPPQMLVSMDRTRLKLGWNEPLDKLE